MINGQEIWERLQSYFLWGEFFFPIGNIYLIVLHNRKYAERFQILEPPIIDRDS